MRRKRVTRTVFKKMTNIFPLLEHRLLATYPLFARFARRSAGLQIVSLSCNEPFTRERLLAAASLWVEENPFLRLTLTPHERALCIQGTASIPLSVVEASADIPAALEALWVEPKPRDLRWKLYMVSSTPQTIWLLADAKLYDPASLQRSLQRLALLLAYPDAAPEAVALRLGADADDEKELLKAPSPSLHRTLSWSWSTQAQLALAQWGLRAKTKEFWIELLQSLSLISGEDDPITWHELGLYDDRRLAGHGQIHSIDPEGLNRAFGEARTRHPAACEPNSPPLPTCAISMLPPGGERISFHRAQFSSEPLHYIFSPAPEAKQYLSWQNPELSEAQMSTKIALLDEILAMSQADRSLTLARYRFPQVMKRLSAFCERPYDLEQSIHGLLSAAWPAFSSQTAVEALEGSLSYAELDALSRRIALFLEASGLAKGDRIGLSMARGPLMLATLIGVFRAGCAYVPLDPLFPEDRLRYMVDDAGIKALVADASMLFLNPSGSVPIDAKTLLERLAPFRAEDWQVPAIDSGALAYVIYTSGSTGQPKGVMLSHRSVVNFLLSMREEPGMQSGDRMLAVTTLSFDIAVLELFLPLLVGARVYIASADETRDGKLLRRILEERAITHFQATPSLFRLLLDAGWKGSSLKKALCGGEAFPADVARALRPYVAEIWNMYGPTETTVWSAIYRLQGNEVQVPIGRPIANTHIYILDDELNELPPGRKGEIYIGGEGLALGYLGRSELTAERFIAATAARGRIYRTGDLGRLRSDGILEIFGRVDQQIKLRGYRMELGEIEAHVSHLPGVSHCVAAVKEFGPEDQRLIAYVTCPGPFDEKRARLELKKTLPQYMLPQLYVVLPSFPLLPNGKIDRKQLPDPRTLKATPAAEPVADPAPKVPLSPDRAMATDGAVPLTPSQTRMLYVEQLDPGTTVHNLSAAWRIEGPMDPSLFKEALTALVAEQEALRSYVDLSEEVPHLRVAARLDPALPVVVMHQIPYAMQEIEAKILEISRRRLDITRVPHSVMGLFLLPGGQAIFFMLTHHIFWDGFSYGVFWRHLQRHYQEILARGASPIKLPSFSFSDYARDRQRELREPEMKEQLDYWQKRFDPLPEPLEIATDRPRPLELRHYADTVFIPWDEDLDQRLLACSKQHGTTLYHTLLSATFCLLHRLSGQEDIVIGTPVHGRQQSELFELLGNFINVAALRTGLTADSTFAQLLERVKRLTQEAQAHADIPFENIVAALKIPRDPSRTPLYSCMLFFQDQSMQRLRIGDASVTPLALPAQTVDTDLVFWIDRQAGQTQAGLNYRRDLWDKGSAQAIARSFRSLLDQLLRRPVESIARLPMLDSASQSEVLAAGQRAVTGALPLGAEDNRLTLDQWLFEVAAEHPDLQAVEAFEGPSLSYSELSEAALRLAHYLRLKGARRGSIIGVSLPRQSNLVVALAAILRLGAAYLPLDPAFPKARLIYMVEDSGCELIITEMEFYDIFSELSASSVCIDREAQAIATTAPLDAAEEGARPADLAYLIYTSGSTGLPKGVAIAQSAVVHFLKAIRSALRFPRGLRTLALTTISFDISVLEIFGTLVSAGTIVLVPAQLVNDAPFLAEALIRRRIGLLQATPASWRLLLASDWPQLPHLIALTGGEALTQDLARDLLPRVGTLWNVYGPTEATVWATAAQIVDPEQPITIGRVLPGYEALILDSHLHPLPMGAAGRLFLAGPALARGYHARAELTAERFPPHRFLPLDRMYDTGDLARFRSDGTIEYLGRRDQQVKLRGFRIELGEIESVMKEAEAIAQGVCAVREDQPGDQRLIAYIVLKAGCALDLPALHKHLQGRLPKYMLPQHLLILDRMPLTGSGKIDRKQLPAPEASAPAPLAPEPPTQLSPGEEKLARIFRDLLGVSQVAASDNFFDLGGHSLLALRVLHRCQEELGLSLRIRDLLLHSVSQLAQRLEDSPPQTGLRRGDRR